MFEKFLKIRNGATFIWGYCGLLEANFFYVSCSSHIYLFFDLNILGSWKRFANKWQLGLSIGEFWCKSLKVNDINSLKREKHDKTA